MPQKIISYRDYVRRTFTRYAAVLILLAVLLYAVAMAVNFYLTAIRGTARAGGQAEDYFRLQYEQYHTGVQELSADDAVRTALRHRGSRDKKAAYEALYRFAASGKVAGYFLLADSAGQVVCTNLYQPNSDRFVGDPSIRSAMDKLAGDGGLVYTGTTGLAYTGGQAGNYAFGKAVPGDGGEAMGYLFLEWGDEDVHAFVRSLQVSELTLTDRFDNIIYTTNRQSSDPLDKYPVGKYQPRYTGNFAELDGRLYYVTAGRLEGSGLQIHALAAVDMQVQMLVYGGVFLVVMSLVLGLLVHLLTRVVTRSSLRSIDELVLAVGRYSGEDTGYRIREEGQFEEFETLYGAFNQLMDRIEELIGRNAEMAERKRLMEVRQLENQFRPHFVYNVLEMLRYEILLDPEKASELVVSFAALMRYSIHYGSARVPLQTDIEYTNDYLLIQQPRYNGFLSYHISIPDELMGCQVPKLLLQTLVENSLVHGYVKGKPLDINITAARQDGSLLLVVADNGKGMGPRRLEDIRHLLGQESVDPSHIGVYNVHRVVRMQYGEPYGLSIDSEEERGTTVRLTLPLEQGGSDEPHPGG